MSAPAAVAPRRRVGRARAATAGRPLWSLLVVVVAFVGDNHEYPVNPDVAPDDVIAGFGDFTPMPINAEAYGDLNAEAVDLLAEAGYE